MAASVLTVPERLRAAATLFETRNKSYGANYVHFGRVLRAMFPDGIRADTEEDMQRLMLLCLQVTKITRYARNLNKGGHSDSAQDGAVYWLMADEQDELHRLGNSPTVDPAPEPPADVDESDEWWQNLPELTRRSIMQKFEQTLRSSDKHPPPNLWSDHK